MMQRHPIESVAALLVLAALSGCGESDLPAHHDEVLACAELESLGGRCDGEPLQGAAQSPFADRPAGQLAPGEEPVEGIDLDDYALVFADEFTGDELDTSRWKSALEWGPDLVINGEQQYYIDALGDPGFGATPFSLDGDALTIRATRTPESLRARANEQPWLSGVLSSADRFDMRYGYIETRVDLPEGVGTWPAFWLLASELDEQRPRVFIAEHDGGRPASVFHDYRYEDDTGAVRSAGQYRVEVPDLSEGFHTLAVSWTPDELVYYVDGIARYRVIGEELPARSMYMVLNLAIGGSFVGMPDESVTSEPALRIDYVRVWQREGS